MTGGKVGDAGKPPLVLTDAEVNQSYDMKAAISAVEALLTAKSRKSFTSPPRHKVSFGKMTELMFSIGGDLNSVSGFRAYMSRATVHLDDQLVAVWDSPSAKLKGVILGAALGIIRMGAIGGVAIRALSRPDARIACIIGTGRQAASHLEAATAVRDIEEIRVFGRNADRCHSFAHRMSQKTGVAVVPQESARRAVEGADIVVLATNSLRPVIEASWLSPGCFVHTVGYKSPAGREMDLDVAGRAGVLATDSLEQVTAFGHRFILHDTPHVNRLQDLCNIVSERTTFRAAPDIIRVCYPVGVTGSEVVIADEVLKHYR